MLAKTENGFYSLLFFECEYICCEIHNSNLLNLLIWISNRRECTEFFVVEAYGHFKITKKENRQSVYCGGFFICSTCFYLQRHMFEFVFSISLNFDWNMCCKETQNKPFKLVNIWIFWRMNLNYSFSHLWQGKYKVLHRFQS